MGTYRKLILSIFGTSFLAVLPAAAEDFLSGRYELNMKESKWKAGTPMTGGYWVFEKDDGKTRRGYVAQFLPNGRMSSYIYNDVRYDGQFNWLNDWYSEANSKIDNNTFQFDYKVQREGMKEAVSGSAVCKISPDRRRITCSNADMVEVYEKR